MILKKLSILNYRNIKEAQLEFSPKLNCLVGQNGVGKTNLLDAIYYLSFSRSALGPTNQHVLRHEQEAMMLRGIYYSDQGEELDIHCALRAGRRKSFKRNGKEYQKASDHIGLIPMVMVSPADSELILGASEARRRFIDTAISQYSPTYLQQLIRYNEALQQRNYLLKSETPPDETLLSTYDQIMAQAGQIIYQERRKFIESFAPIFSEIYSNLTDKKEDVALHYKSHLNEAPLLELLQTHHLKDHIVGHTLKGIHRDDLEMTLSAYPIRYEGSQGQAKSYVIALRLAQYLYLKNTINNRAPLLLLDDIFDKLDSQRVSRIIQIVSGQQYGQIFITSTSSHTLRQVVKQSSQDYRFFTVSNGHYEES